MLTSSKFHLPHRTSNHRLLCRPSLSLPSLGNMLFAPEYFLRFQIRLGRMGRIDGGLDNTCSGRGSLREFRQTGQMRIDEIDLKVCKKVPPTQAMKPIVPVRLSLINRIS